MNDEIFQKIKNDTLYISYYDVINKTFIVKHNYETKEDLKETILKSCHFPFLVDGHCLFKNQFVDGCIPHIFPEREKSDNHHILYITINRFSQVKGLFNTHNEKNVHGRALEGVLDIYQFFLYDKPTKICSYVHQWSLFDYTKLRIKQFLSLLIIYFIHNCINIHTKLKPYLDTIEIFHYIQPITSYFYQDFLLYFCF